MSGVPGRSGGHNRKSEGRKKLEGSWRADRAKSAVTAPPDGSAPEIPAWIAERPIAKEAWDWIVGTMTDLGTIRPAYGRQIAAAAMAEDEYRSATEMKPKESAWRRWHQALGALGLQPVTLARVEGVKSKPIEDNPFDEFGQ